MTKPPAIKNHAKGGKNESKHPSPKIDEEKKKNNQSLLF
jgi:hypothetical protein